MTPKKMRSTMLSTAPTFAGIGYEIVIATVITPGPGKAVGKNAASWCECGLACN